MQQQQALEQHTVIVTSNVDDSRNTSSHFFNRLAKPLILTQGQWKVAVKKMIYLNAFLNIINESFTTKRWLEKTISGTLAVEDGDGDAANVKHKPIPTGMDNVLVHLHKPDKATKKYTHLTLQVNSNTELKLVDNMHYELYYHLKATDKVGKLVRRYTFGSAELSRGNYHITYVVPMQIPTAAESISIWFNWYHIVTFRIPPNNYGTMAALLAAMPPQQEYGVLFGLADGFVTVQLDSTVEYVQFNNDLNLTLGISGTRFTSSIRAIHLPQLNRGRFALFLYSNIVPNVRVGNMEVPLLDVINVPKREFAEVITLDVINPLYREVALKAINEIEIKLASDSGELVTFDNRAGNAKTLLVLHFVRVI